MVPNASEELRFDDRIVIITGAGGGMGREHAVLFAKRGAAVIINDLSDEGLQTTKKMIKETGSKVVTVQGSVADRQVLERVISAAIENFGRIDILVNNAGIEIKKPFDQFSQAEVGQMFDVHFHGSWNLTQLVWPHMKQQGYGKIVMVCSTSLYGMPQNSAYASAKGALLALSKALAYEGREFNIHVNALAPAAFTNMAKQMLADDSGWAWMAEHYPAWAVSPVLCWMCHHTCSLRGQIVTSWGRNFGKIFIGETIGLHVDGDYTIETVRDGWAEASKEQGYFVPGDVIEQNQTLEKSRAVHMGGQSSGDKPFG